MALRDASGRFVSSGTTGGLGLRAHIKDEMHRVRQAAAQAAIRSIRHAAAYVRVVIANSLRTSPKPSAAGSPPHSKTRQLKRAIKFAVLSQYYAVVGSTYTDAGPTGGKHERGGPFRGANYPPRPFAGPGLERARPRIPLFYRDSIRPL